MRARNGGPATSTRVRVGVALVLLFVAGCTGSNEGGDPSLNLPGSSSPSTTSQATYLGLPVEHARSAHLVADHSAAGFMVAQATPRRLWVGSPTGLSWIDPDDESVHHVDAEPGVYLSIHRGSLYRTAYYEGDVARYDVSGPDPREVARVGAPAPLQASVDRSGFWVSDHDGGRLLLLDLRTLARRGALQLGPRSGEGHALAGQAQTGDGRLWVVSERDQRLYEIDTEKGRAAGHVQLDAPPTAELVRDGNHLWVMLSRTENDDDADLALVDAASRRVVTRVVAHDDAFVTSKNRDLLGSSPVVVDGEVWVPTDEHLVHLDAAQGWKPDRVVALPVPGMFARFATEAFGSLWIYSSLPRELIVRVPLDELG